MIPRSGRPPEGGSGNPLQPGKPHGWSGLAGYSPWGHKESGRTEHTHIHTQAQETKAILLKANLFSPSVSYFYLLFPVSFSPFLTQPLICNSSASVSLRYLHASIHIASFFLSLYLILFLAESGKEVWAEERLVSLGPLLHGSPST